MVSDDGTSFTPLFGPGLTGLKNLGNTCYMASVVQILNSIPAFKQKYTFHYERCTAEQPSDCFYCQFHKLFDGLTSGVYSVNGGTDENILQTGIAPVAFKEMVGRGHPDFATARQQDAQDYLCHLLSFVERKEHSSGSDPSRLFHSVLEIKSKCSDCSQGFYT